MIIALYCLAWGFCQAYRVDVVVDILREMARRNHKIGNRAYRPIIRALCKSEKEDIAIQVLEILINQIKPDAAIYESLIKG